MKKREGAQKTKPASAVVAVLEVMWDWEEQTSRAGYTQRAPKWFKINPRNKTGSVLYHLVEPRYGLLVTNACPQVVSHPSQHGTPDTEWLRTNLQQLVSYGWVGCLLVCGKVANKTFDECGFDRECRVVRIPHPAARMWKRRDLEWVRQVIQESDASITATYVRNRLVMRMDHGKTEDSS